ncbi:MAG: LUD domain-containing protein, partial [Bacteroidales bacterium]
LSYGNSPKDAVVKKVGCCACKYLLARTGSMVFDSSQVGRKIFASAEVLLFFATMRELVPDMKTALKQIKESRQPFPSMLSTWTGLSKITDIDMDEKNGLGPDKIFLFLIDEFETKE